MVYLFQPPMFAYRPLGRAITLPMPVAYNPPQYMTFNYIQYPILTMPPPAAAKHEEKETPPVEAPRAIEAPAAPPLLAPRPSISLRMSFYAVDAVTGAAANVDYDSPPAVDRLFTDVKHYARRVGVAYNTDKWVITLCALHADADADDVRVAKGVIGPVVDDSVVCVVDGDGDVRAWDALWRGVVRSGHRPVAIVQEKRNTDTVGDGEASGC